MVAKHPLFWAYLFLNVVGTNAEFRIIYSPPSLQFFPTSKTLESLMKEVVCACLGLPVDENSVWKGLHILDPFSTPEAAVQVYIEGISSVGSYNGTNVISYPITVGEYELNIYEAVKHRIAQTSTGGGHKLINVKLSDPQEFTTQNFIDIFGANNLAMMPKQPLKYLKYAIEADYQFLNELHALKSMSDRVLSGALVPDHIVDLYNFQFRSLHDISDQYGPKSSQIEEAKELLGYALQDISKAFVTAYHGSVFISTIATDVTHSRRHARSPDDEPTTAATEASTINTQETKSATNAEFPVMFSILLWFGLLYTFSLVAVVYVMMDMDPGRDSVIYRMTNIRMKKDV